MSRKIKHSLELKIAIVKQVLERSRSIKRVSEDHQIHHRLVQRWVQFYQRYGEAGLMPQSNSYSLETKLAVINSVTDNNLSLRGACLQFNIRSTSVLTKWMSIYQQEGIEGLAIERRGKSNPMASKDSSKKKVQPLTDHEKVLEENRLLRAENDYLKKLRALIQKEEEEKKRKR
jgi:transposase